MAGPGKNLDVLLSVGTEFAALKQLEGQLENQIAKARALGKAYDDAAGDLCKVRARLEEIAKQPALPDALNPEKNLPKTGDQLNEFAIRSGRAGQSAFRMEQRLQGLGAASLGLSNPLTQAADRLEYLQFIANNTGVSLGKLAGLMASGLALGAVSAATWQLIQYDIQLIQEIAAIDEAAKKSGASLREMLGTAAATTFENKLKNIATIVESLLKGETPTEEVQRRMTPQLDALRVKQTEVNTLEKINAGRAELLGGKQSTEGLIKMRDELIDSGRVSGAQGLQLSRSEVISAFKALADEGNKLAAAKRQELAQTSAKIDADTKQMAIQVSFDREEERIRQMRVANESPETIDQAAAILAQARAENVIVGGEQFEKIRNFQVGRLSRAKEQADAQAKADKEAADAQARADKEAADAAARQAKEAFEAEKISRQNKIYFARQGGAAPEDVQRMQEELSFWERNNRPGTAAPSVAVPPLPTIGQPAPPVPSIAQQGASPAEVAAAVKSLGPELANNFDAILKEVMELRRQLATQASKIASAGAYTP